MKSTKFITLLAASVLVMAGCGEPPAPEKHDLKVNGERIVGVTEVVSFTTDAPEGHAVTWESSDTQVATVDASGKVTGKGVGFADIKATCSTDGSVGTFTVSVEDCSFELTSATDWTATEKAEMEDALYDNVLPFMAFGDDYEMEAYSSTGSSSNDTVEITDSYKLDLSADYEKKLVAAGYKKVEMQGGGAGFLLSSATDYTYVLVQCGFEAHKGNWVVAYSDFNVDRNGDWNSVNVKVGQFLVDTEFPALPEIDVDWTNWIVPTFKIGDEFIVQIPLELYTVEDVFEKFIYDCADAGILYGGYLDYLDAYLFTDFEQDAIMLAMMDSAPQYGYDLLMLDIQREDDPAYQADIRAEFPADEINEFLELEEGEVATDGAVAPEDKDERGFSVYVPSSEAYFGITTRAVGLTDAQQVEMVADYAETLTTAGWTVCYEEDATEGFAISPNSLVLAEFDFVSCVFEVYFSNYEIPEYDEELVTDELFWGLVDKYAAPQGLADTIETPFEAIMASNKFVGVDGSQVYAVFYTPYASVLDTYVSELVANNWYIMPTDDPLDVYALSPDLQVEANMYYLDQYGAMKVDFVPATEFTQWPEERIEAIIEAINPDFAGVLPEFETKNATFYINDKTPNNAGATIWALGANKTECVSYVAGIESDATNWVVDQSMLNTGKQGVYHDVNESISLTVTWDSTTNESSIAIKKYLVFGDNWDSTGIETMLGYVFCLDTLPAFVPTEGMTNKYASEMGTYGPIAYVQADTANEETVHDLQNAYGTLLATSKFVWDDENKWFTSPNGEFIVELSADNANNALVITTSAYGLSRTNFGYTVGNLYSNLNMGYALAEVIHNFGLTPFDSYDGVYSFAFITQSALPFMFLYSYEIDTLYSTLADGYLSDTENWTGQKQSVSGMEVCIIKNVGFYSDETYVYGCQLFIFSPELTEACTAETNAIVIQFNVYLAGYVEE